MSYLDLAESYRYETWRYSQESFDYQVEIDLHMQFLDTDTRLRPSGNNVFLVHFSKFLLSNPCKLFWTDINTSVEKPSSKNLHTISVDTAFLLVTTERFLNTTDTVVRIATL
jgi:hypothetical protein